MDSAVPDVLGPGVRLVFVGINPGLRSAQAGHHFANPRNDFWRLLHDSGLTPELLDPSEDAQLLAAGLGITNAAMRVTRGSSELRRTNRILESAMVSADPVCSVPSSSPNTSPGR